MKTIELQKIIQDHQLDVRDLAKELFPSHQHPSMALTRIIQGKGVLDANQISLLSEITGQSINSLFNQSEWVAQSREGIIFFFFFYFRAELDMYNIISKVFHKYSIFHETILHTTIIPLSEYLKEISASVLKFKNKK